MSFCITSLEKIPLSGLYDKTEKIYRLKWFLHYLEMPIFYLKTKHKTIRLAFYSVVYKCILNTVVVKLTNCSTFSSIKYQKLLCLL